MDSIFWGLVFLFVQISFTVNGHTITLLPAFLGYCLIYWGTRTLPASKVFTGMKLLLTFAGVWAALVWTANLFGWMPEGVKSVWQLVSAVFEFVVLHFLIQGVCELEQLRWRELPSAKLGSGTLRRAWLCYVAVTLLSMLFRWSAWLTVPFFIVGAAAQIIYLVCFYRAGVSWKESGQV